MRIPIQYSAQSIAGPPGGATSPKKLQLVADREHQDQPTPAEQNRPSLAQELDHALRQTERLSADFDNYRRHAEARIATARTDATLEVLSELGDVLRSLELAIESSDRDEQEPKAIQEGVALVVRGLKAVFDRHGLLRIPTKGHAFDPRMHEAILTEPRDDYERGTVVRELSPGFQTEDHVVRPAKVAVAS